MDDRKASLSEKLKKIKVLLLDVDGVLTDGRIIYDSKGRDLKFFDVHDGMGVHLLKMAGIKVVLVSAKGSKTIGLRARDMGVDAIFENSSPKTSCFNKVLRRFKAAPDELMFVGDDLVDLCLMKAVGVSVAVSNACSEVRNEAMYITERSGGRGAVREISELILRSQGKWEEAIGKYVKG